MSQVLLCNKQTQILVIRRSKHLFFMYLCTDCEVLLALSGLCLAVLNYYPRLRTSTHLSVYIPLAKTNDEAKSNTSMHGDRQTLHLISGAKKLQRRGVDFGDVKERPG